MNIAVFTFRTFKNTELLNDHFQNVSVFGKLKQDISSFIDHIKEEQPDLVLGVAASTDGSSRFEATTINQFNEKKIAHSDIDEINLHTPSNPKFIIAKKPTHSFCNYATYKIALAIQEQQLGIPIAFTHIATKDLDELKHLSE